MPEFMLDSIVETIKNIDNAMKCPFCKTNPLRFVSFETRYSQSQDLETACVSCKIKLTFVAKEQSQGWNKPKKKMWEIGKIETLSHYEAEKITENKPLPP